jgi:hypothetical protein
MSDSYAVLPLTPEVRTWLDSEGIDSPTIDGKPITLRELKAIIASLPGIPAEWSNGPEFFDGALSSISGMNTSIIVGHPGSDSKPCEFHFRGGESGIIETVVSGVAQHAGPQVIYAHSGGFTKVVQ